MATAASLDHRRLDEQADLLFAEKLDALRREKEDKVHAAVGSVHAQIRRIEALLSGQLEYAMRQHGKQTQAAFERHPVYESVTRVLDGTEEKLEVALPSYRHLENNPESG